MMLFSLAKLLHFFCIYKFDTIFYTLILYFILYFILFLYYSLYYSFIALKSRSQIPLICSLSFMMLLSAVSPSTLRFELSHRRI